MAIIPRADKRLACFCLFPSLAGVAALLGWTIARGSLQLLPPWLIQMNPLTALCFIVLAAALWLRVDSRARRWSPMVSAAAWVVAALGALKLSSYLIGFDFPVDRWMFAHSIGDNRMAPNTALCFMLCGAAIAEIDRVTRRGFWPAQAAVLVVATVSLMSLIGWTYGATSMYRVASYTPMALNTAASFGVLAVGILLARSERGAAAIVFDGGVGGMMARRLLPAVIAIPWLLGGLRLVGQRLGYYDMELGSAMLVALTVMLFVVAITWNAAALNRSDAERSQAAEQQKRAEEAVRRLNAELEQRVIDRTAELAAANADLTQKNRENETFVYSASHDLRSPLVNLQGFSQELVRTSQDIRELIADGGWPAEKAERGLKLIDVDMDRGIRFIQTAVSRLDGIIDALLRLSRAGRVEYRPRLIDVNQLVARIIESMSGTLYDHGVSVDVADLPPCWCDPTAAEQVFANLLGNAVNYLDPARPGKIDVGSRPAEATGEGGGPATTYFVKDNGLGIASAHSGKIFQALKRLHPAAAKGEGIGLAIAKRIVDRHGGAIWFDSAVGVGSTFFVSLPNTSATPLSAPVTRAPDQLRSSHEDPRATRNPVGGRR